VDLDLGVERRIWILAVTESLPLHFSARAPTISMPAQAPTPCSWFLMQRGFLRGNNGRFKVCP
jgi:hypothetical protein